MALTQATGKLAEEFGGTKLLIGDLATTFVLLNHARRRTIEKVFGVPPEQADLLSWVVLLMLLTGTKKKLDNLHAPKPPPPIDWLFAGGAIEEALRDLTGPPPSDIPLIGPLIVLGLVAGTVGPVVKRSLHDARAASHRMATGFHHRYGYLVDPGHWRARRAERREAMEARPA